MMFFMHLKSASCPSAYHLLYLIPMLYFFIGSTSKVVPVKVGVVLDMNTDVGKMSMTSMRIALADFYAANQEYQTRLVLITRDSEGVISAAATVIDLLKNVQVEAIIGPLTSMDAYFVIHLGDKAHVPIITFTATSPSLASIKSSYFFRTTLSDSSQVDAISAIVEAFGWREVTLIYVDDEFGQGILSSLSDALEQKYVRIPYRSAIPSSATDEQIDAELYKLMSMHTRVFIVHMVKSLGSRFFMKAKQLGMMSKDYAWIITNAMANAIDSLSPSILKSMTGVLGVRSYVPKTVKLKQFQKHYKEQLLLNNGTSELTIFGLWAYDTITALAMAVESASRSFGNTTFLIPNASSKPTDLESFGVSDMGLNLIHALSNTTFQGLGGTFKLVNQQLQSPPYEVLNVVGSRAREVGYWIEKYGIITEANSTIQSSNSKDNFKPIIWPGDRTSPPKGWVLPVNEKKLRILVPVQDRVSKFAYVTWNEDNSAKVQGLSIDVFETVVAELPYGLPYEYIPFVTQDRSSAGTYNDMVHQIYLGNYDALIGDVTIMANRSQFVDFSLPYIESGISMVVPYVPNNHKAWVFLKPLTWKLWLTSFWSFVIIAVVIWILEHKETGTEFKGTLHHQIGMILWYSFSTMVFAQRENLNNNFARILMIIWFFVVLILTQSYTASLASLLTIQQLQPSVQDVKTLLQTNAYVGYPKPSFMKGFLLNLNFDPSRMLPYSSSKELHDLFTNGSGNGGIAAAFDEIPYLNLFLSEYCSQYTMIGPIYKTDGFGFVFPTGSPLVSDISKKVLNVTESDLMFQITNKWLGDSRICQTSSPYPSSSLGLESFWGLFAIVGATAVFFIVLHTVILKYQHRDEPQNDAQEIDAHLGNLQHNGAPDIILHHGNLPQNNAQEIDAHQGNLQHNGAPDIIPHQGNLPQNDAHDIGVHQNTLPQNDVEDTTAHQVNLPHHGGEEIAGHPRDLNG